MPVSARLHVAQLDHVRRRYVLGDPPGFIGSSDNPWTKWWSNWPFQKGDVCLKSPETTWKYQLQNAWICQKHVWIIRNTPRVCDACLGGWWKTVCNNGLKNRYPNKVGRSKPDNSSGFWAHPPLSNSLWETWFDHSRGWFFMKGMGITYHILSARFVQIWNIGRCSVPWAWLSHVPSVFFHNPQETS